MPRFHNTRALGQFLNRQNANTRKLNSAVGGQIRARDRDLSRISGGDPIEAFIRQLAERDSAFDKFLDSIPKTIFSSVRSEIGRNSGISDIFGGSPRQSQGQIWADMANSITRAISRNL